MNIKLSDFILEQTVSTASIIDIELEQAVAEVEVGSALLEAYFKQAEMYGKVYTESLEDEVENSEIQDATDKKQVQQAEKTVMAQSQGTDVKVNTYESGIKAFFKGIGSWFVKIWTKLIGWISEKRIDSLIKRLDKMTPSDRQTMKVEINLNYNTRVEKDEELSGTTLDQTKTYYDVGFILDTGKDFIDILTKMKNNTWVSGEDVNSLISDIDEFKHNLGNTRKFNNDNSKTKTINGDELRTILRSIRDQVDKNKEHVKQLRNELVKNKNIGEQIADHFTKADDKAGKRIYKAIKSSYSAYSTYMAYQMTSLMKLISESNVKNEMKNPSGKSKESHEADEDQPIQDII